MMKTLAREVNLPIICLSQLSRKVEERQGHRPMMSDLRESGCLSSETIIQDAKTKQRYTIKQLAERKEQIPIFVHGVDENLRMSSHRMTKVFYSGKKKTFRLTTRLGKSIKASANHPFLRLGDWTALEMLQVGDQIGILGEIPSDLLWDEVQSIEELEVEEVYDATVENVHNFVANGIIVHNSIEQDSDIVMFLLRREYYDPFDKPGSAELIIAKNRHGAVGNINLTYRKELAQFANYSPMQTKGGNNDEAFAAFSPGYNQTT
jgi:replicative DNA helicase